MGAGRGAAGWVETFPEDLWLAGDEGTEERAEFIRRALHLGAGSRVLDAPCGAGRICVHLAAAGCRVAGVDRNPRFIARCRRRFAGLRLAGDFRVGDLREMDFDAEFDGAFNWGGSFGYFSDAANEDILRRYVRALKRGGRLLIDQPNREYVLRHFHAKMTQGRITTRSRWRPDVERVDTRWCVTTGGRERRSLSSIRLYTVGQFRTLFESAGLEFEAVLGPDGAPARKSSRRIYIVGRKP